MHNVKIHACHNNALKHTKNMDNDYLKYKALLFSANV